MLNIWNLLSIVPSEDPETGKMITELTIPEALLYAVIGFIVTFIGIVIIVDATFSIIFEGCFNNGIHSLLLLLGHGIDNLGDCLIAIVLLGFGLFSHLFFSFRSLLLFLGRGLVSVIKRNLISAEDDRLVLGLLSVAHNILDICPGVRSGQNQTRPVNISDGLLLSIVKSHISK